MDNENKLWVDMIAGIIKDNLVHLNSKDYLKESVAKTFISLCLDALNLFGTKNGLKIDVIEKSVGKTRSIDSIEIIDMSGGENLFSFHFN